MLDAIMSWETFLVALLVFGFAPRALLRVIALGFHPDDPRRRELLAELHAVPRIERPFWVLEQLEVALFEGLPRRVTTRRERRRARLRKSLAAHHIHQDRKIGAEAEAQRYGADPGRTGLSSWGT